MIDTEDKRRSVQAYTLGIMRPRADGAITVGDRATSAWVYSGLAYSGGAGTSNQWLPRHRRRNRR